MKLSVIIPTLNEEKALHETLCALRVAPNDDVEVIIVDGGSTDETLIHAARWPGLRILSAEQGRAAQLRAGAAAARGELLLFLHADTRLPTEWLRQMLALSDHTVWGGFRQQFSGDRRVLRFISRLHNFRCGLTRVFYGDQAMFVNRKLYEQVGGFPEDGHMEDIRLSEALRAEQDPIFLGSTVVTDSRKFDQLGAWRCLWYCLTLLAAYELRRPPAQHAFFDPVR